MYEIICLHNLKNVSLYHNFNIFSEENICLKLATNSVHDDHF